MPAASDVVQGTLDLLVLKALSLAPLHGWGLRGCYELWRSLMTFGSMRQAKAR
jgi:hypothetical protein